MTIRSLSTTFALSLITLTAGAFAQAGIQSAHGTLRGAVLDPSGALIPRAQVTVTDAEGFARTLTSDDNGSFEVPALAAGSYSVAISATGFTCAMADVKITDGDVTEEKVRLGISVEQEIEVFAR